MTRKATLREHWWSADVSSGEPSSNRTTTDGTAINPSPVAGSGSSRGDGRLVHHDSAQGAGSRTALILGR